MADRAIGGFSLPDRRDLAIAAAFALIGLLLFLWRIGDPAKPNFDESHYLPAAKSLLAMDRLINMEHPPLGKLMIAASIGLFGETPAGWRIMSALFGALTLFSGFMAARWLFLRRPAAVMTAMLMLFSQTLFIQARIAMLDIFMAGLLMTGFWLLAAFVRTGFSRRPHLVLGALCLGLATACKWTAIPCIAVGLPLLLWLRWKARDASTDAQPLPMRELLGWLGPFAAFAYLATFLPYLNLRFDAVSLGGIIPHQLAMLERQSAPMGTHPYQSLWWQWVLDLRPIWYFYEPVAGVQRGVLYLGNPVLCWGGLLGLLACLWAGLREKARALLVPVLLWAAPLAFFILVPKPVQFYYHYFLPTLMLCLASGAALDHYFQRRGARIVPWLTIGLAGLVFLEFYPIISAAALGDPQDFNRWMWLESWR